MMIAQSPLAFSIRPKQGILSDVEIFNNNRQRTPHLQVNVDVSVTVCVLMLPTRAVAVTVTAPVVAPRQVAVPLSLG